MPMARLNKPDIQRKRTKISAVAKLLTRTRQNDGALNFYCLHLPSRFFIFRGGRDAKETKGKH